VFPHVETRAQAVDAIRSMRYAPQRGSKIPVEPVGRRGWNPGRAAALWGFPVNQYAFERADVWPLNPQGELFALIMIETADGVKHIDEIVRVPGVGGILIGASDLGVSLGVGRPTNGVNATETEAAVQRVLMACKRSKVACAYPVLGGQDELERRRREGFKVFLDLHRPATTLALLPATTAMTPFDTTITAIAPARLCFRHIRSAATIDAAVTPAFTAHSAAGLPASPRIIPFVSLAAPDPTALSVVYAS
jgi:hypothetical protein